jgi:3-hydroxybutyryl-CoA dehydrogenase
MYVYGISLQKLRGMNIAVLANKQQQQEWLQKPTPGFIQIMWVQNFETFISITADVYVDLLFVATHIQKLTALNKPVFINEVTQTLQKLLPVNSQAFIARINAWPGMLKKPVVEVCVHQNNHQVTDIFEQLQWKYQLVNDEPGMVTPRIICMIINEAYHALGENVADTNAIDTAMKLGTNYPYGPFEWAAIIGLKNVYELLQTLTTMNANYTPAPALTKAALAK